MEHLMNRCGSLRIHAFSTIVVAVVIAAQFFGPNRVLSLELPDPYAGVREATRQFIALGTPDDLLRLREALDRTEQEIARRRLGVGSDNRDADAERQKRLNDVKERLSETQALLRMLERSSRQVSDKRLDPTTVKLRNALRRNLSSREADFKNAISALEKDIASERADHLKTLEEERRVLARIIAVRREQLLAEYQTLSGCPVEDRPCVAKKLRILCRLQPLFPSDERAPVVTLIEETTAHLNFGQGSSSPLCEYLRHDFAF
jgi:hypothetical protein